MTVLVVEDDKKLAKLLLRVLSEEGFVAEVCGTGREALARLASGGVELVVLDRMLPDLDGLDVCRAMREAHDVTPVLMLTARGELRDRLDGFETGADDYVVKPFEVEELVARARALLRRVKAPAPQRVGPLVIDRVAHLVLLEGARLDLTPLELSLLTLLADEAGRPVARAELLARVWQLEFDPGTNLVEVHMSRLRDKLGAHAGLIETVRGKGYRLRVEHGR